MVTELIVLVASERLQIKKEAFNQGQLRLMVYLCVYFKSQRFNTAHCNALLENLFRTVQGLWWHFVLD